MVTVPIIYFLNGNSDKHNFFNVKEAFVEIPNEGQSNIVGGGRRKSRVPKCFCTLHVINHHKALWPLFNVMSISWILSCIFTPPESNLCVLSNFLNRLLIKLHRAMIPFWRPNRRCTSWSFFGQWGLQWCYHLCS